MLLSFIIYIVFSNLLASKRVINLCTITLFYIMVGIYIGEGSIQYSAKWVELKDLSYIEKSLDYLKIGFYVLLTSFFLLQFFFKEYKLKKDSSNNLQKLFITDVSWGLIILLAIPLYIVFFDIYFPVFEDRTFISKYFQDRLEDFIPYRPFYTLSINALSAILFLQINYFLSSYRKISIFKLFVNKKFLKLLFIFITLFFTAKRGQIFYPLFISLVAYLIYKKHLFKLAFWGSGFVIIVGISRNFSQILKGEGFSLEHILMTLSTSFFVSVRELTRVLLAFDGNGHSFLYGKTYVAGFFSFIPTKINALKANYNYMRYTSIISNQDPNEFGGMRSTYLGEAYVNFGFIGVIVMPVIFAIFVYLLHLFIKKYSQNNFIYYIMVFWVFKILILPFYENGSSMFLFFFITAIFMIISGIKIRKKNNRVVLKISFLQKK